MELYNLRTDIEETRNLAEQYPEIIERAVKILKNEHTEPELEKFKIPGLRNYDHQGR
ncbi:MAG TPA: hypothetical protein VLZ54_04175 [Arenibacter sp.]|nr:hypothetical protein [Arenibacter sp.]